MSISSSVHWPFSYPPLQSVCISFCPFFFNWFILFLSVVAVVYISRIYKQLLQLLQLLQLVYLVLISCSSCLYILDMCPFWKCVLQIFSWGDRFQSDIKNFPITGRAQPRTLSCKVTSDSFVTPWTVACQAALPMGFSRQEYWVGCHFLLQGIFPTQGLNPGLLHWQTDTLPLSHLGNPKRD